MSTRKEQSPGVEQNTNTISPSQLQKAFVKSFIEEVFNKHNSAAADKYLIQHNPMGGQVTEGFKKFLSVLFSAFPDLHANIEHMVVFLVG